MTHAKPPRIIVRPAFEVIGPKTWIGGQDNEQFGRFWQECRASGLLQTVQRIQQSSGQPAGAQTSGAVLGISRVEVDPANRQFYYMIAVEMPASGLPAGVPEEGLERFTVPAGEWAVFECHGPVPHALVASEMYAFMEWLPSSGCQHASAPEMEVYPATNEPYCEFWLPICPKTEKNISASLA